MTFEQIQKGAKEDRALWREVFSVLILTPYLNVKTFHSGGDFLQFSPL